MGGGVSLLTHPSGFDDKYEYVENSEVLGIGAFSTVKVAVNKLTRDEVAVKVIKKDAKLDSNDIEGINREISILKILDCPYTIKLIDVYEEKADYRIVNELVNQRMIEHILTVNKYNEKMARNIIEQVLLGLQYIHGKYIFILLKLSYYINYINVTTIITIIIIYYNHYNSLMI